jgi:hypothetical protein
LRSSAVYTAQHLLRHRAIVERWRDTHDGSPLFPGEGDSAADFKIELITSPAGDKYGAGFLLALACIRLLDHGCRWRPARVFRSFSTIKEDLDAQAVDDARRDGGNRRGERAALAGSGRQLQRSRDQRQAQELHANSGGVPRLGSVVPTRTDAGLQRVALLVRMVLIAKA